MSLENKLEKLRIELEEHADSDKKSSWVASSVIKWRWRTEESDRGDDS
jgi:hypothetical protein